MLPYVLSCSFCWFQKSNAIFSICMFVIFTAFIFLVSGELLENKETSVHTGRLIECNPALRIFKKCPCVTFQHASSSSFTVGANFSSFSNIASPGPRARIFQMKQFESSYQLLSRGRAVVQSVALCSALRCDAVMDRSRIACFKYATIQRPNTGRVQKQFKILNCLNLFFRPWVVSGVTYHRQTIENKIKTVKNRKKIRKL